MRMPKLAEDAFEKWCEENEVEDPTPEDVARFEAEVEEAAEEWVAANCGDDY